jgi:serine protease Do
MATWLESLAESAATIALVARDSLVTVAHRGRGVGSGVLWAPGWVVTNAHVARGRGLFVRMNGGDPIAARIRASDDRTDLALLEVEALAATPAEIGDSTVLRPGEWVFAVGNPWGVAGGITGGVVIDPAAGPAHDLLALGLHLRPGHSGGAVVNARGQVVGVNTMMNGPDVGVAISSESVKRFLATAGLGRAMSGLPRAA